MGTAIVRHHRPRPPGVSEHAHQEDEAALCRDPWHPAGLPAQRWREAHPELRWPPGAVSDDAANLRAGARGAVMQTAASHALGAVGKTEQDEGDRGQLAPRSAGGALIGWRISPDRPSYPVWANF